MLRLLAYGAGQDDIVLILHMDRRDHLLMNYANRFDRLPIKEQESLAMLVRNVTVIIRTIFLFFF
jgi:desumoylating isopeptidase 1